MLPRSPLARRLWAASAVLLASVVSVKALRGSIKPYAPEAPSYRQKGEAGAPVVIVEFSDLQCPACRFAVGPVKDLLKLYGRDVRLIFKHVPLNQHKLAVPAAVAAECAGRQGRFWEFHDLAYEKQLDWSPVPPPGQAEAPPPDQEAARKAFVSYAKKLGLDPAAFSACLQDPAAAALVEKDRQEADQRWVLSTPTFFINGRRLVGARQLSEGGVPWIDKILKKH
ncbi:MAG: thioredoxin domain-containing protein [Elusimicrobia bacterium]|nr:thioredoxin domain-containing protein [Elusimicrobiota bacterium]